MSHNTFIHRAARVLVRPLVHTPVTPNQVTTVRLLAGIAAAAAMAAGTDFWRNIGGALFLVSLVLDRADGELARLSGKTSPFGHTYDLLADGAANAMLFVGLGIGLRDGLLGLWAVPLGAVAGLAVAAILWLVMRAERQQGARAAELTTNVGIDPDDGMLAIPVGVWLGLAQPLLIAAAIGAPAFAIFFFWKFRRHIAGD